MSISTADSSTLYNDSEGSSKATARRYRQSESGSSSMTDFGMQSPTSPSSRHRTLLSDHPSRPVSTATTMTQRSDDKRSSRYAASLSSHDSHHHLSSISAHLSRYSGKEEFNYPRPANDEEIEVLFEQVRQTRGLGELPGLTTDQKWQMVHSDEQLKWKQERQREREEQARKQVETGQPAVLIDGTPEFYIKKFMDSTITAKQAGSLLVSLRGKEVSRFQHFIELRGTSVLAQTLSRISRKAMQRRKEDIEIEYEVARIFKYISHNTWAVQEALTHPTIVTQLASSLNTPHLPTRKLLLENLVFFVYQPDSQVQELVISALSTLSNDNHEHGSCYTYWFKSFEQALIGRGRMGTLVGASEDVKRHGGGDASLNDYTVTNLLLVVGVLESMDDLDMRVHHRAMMEAAGIQSIVRLCRTFTVDAIDRQLNKLQQIMDDDELRLNERMDEDILRDLASPEDVFNALKQKTGGTKAQDYLLSIMQHLLLIREEGPAQAKYFQIIDGAVTDLVMDKHLGQGEARLGRSVEQIIAQSERYQLAEDELAKAHATALRLRLEKEALEEELGQGGDGLVRTLKDRLTWLEETLQVSRENMTKLQDQMVAQRTDYEE